MKAYTKYILVLVGLVTTGVSGYAIYNTGDFKQNGLNFLAGLTLMYGYLEIDQVDRKKEEAAKKKNEQKKSKSSVS